MRLALATVALDDHHALPLVAGDQAVPDELLHGGDILRVEQIGQETQPMDRLSRFRVILDRQAVADDLRLALLEPSVQIERPIGKEDAVGDRREIVHLCRQLQYIHNVADLLGDIRANVFPKHLENLTAQGQRVRDPAFRGEKCAIYIEDLVGAEEIVTEQGFVEKALLEPCRGKVSHRHTILSLVLRQFSAIKWNPLIFLPQQVNTLSFPKVVVPKMRTTTLFA